MEFEYKNVKIEVSDLELDSLLAGTTIKTKMKLQGVGGLLLTTESATVISEGKRVSGKTVITKDAVRQGANIVPKSYKSNVVVQ